MTDYFLETSEKCKIYRKLRKLNSRSLFVPIRKKGGYVICGIIEFLLFIWMGKWFKAPNIQF